jgi:FkbM family methyltransferase
MIQEKKLPLSLRIIRKLSFARKLGVLERLYGRKLSRNGVCWVKCSNGVFWKLDLANACHRWIVFGKYEGGGGIDLAFSVLKNGGVYVDSGANIGQWLLYLGHIEGLKSLAFEPVRSENAWLTECLAAQSTWQTEVFNFGLGAEAAELDIQVNGARSTLQMDWYTAENYVREKISIKKLASVLGGLEIEAVDFWKLDTEGAELEALKGASEYLQQQKIGVIYFECHPSNFQEISALLGTFNYGIFDLVDGQLNKKTDLEIPEMQDLVAIPL